MKNLWVSFEINYDACTCNCIICESFGSLAYSVPDYKKVVSFELRYGGSMVNGHTSLCIPFSVKLAKNSESYIRISRFFFVILIISLVHLSTVFGFTLIDLFYSINTINSNIAVFRL